MGQFIKSFENLLTKRFLIWNLVFLFIVKLALPYSGFQLANILDQIKLFDSRDVIEQTNIARENYGLGPLRASAELDVAADRKLQDMISLGYFEHTNPNGVAPWFWIKQAKYKYVYAGENLAIGFPDAETTVDAWLNSSDHRDNLLNKKYKEIGVAVGKADIDGIAGVLVVQMFGTPMNQALPLASINNEINQNNEIKDASSGVVLGSKEENKSEKPVETSIAVSYVSPEEKIERAGEETIIFSPTEENQNTNQVKNVSKNANQIYLLYAFFVAMISVILIVIHEKNAKGVLVAAANFAIFLLALGVPVIDVIQKGAIL